MKPNEPVINDKVKKLSPCPFCEAENAKIHMPFSAEDIYFIQCNSCGCRTAGFDTPEEATEAWNRRAENVTFAELCEAKRLLKAAVKDFRKATKDCTKDFIDLPCESCPHTYTIHGCVWRYTGKALALIGKRGGK